MSMWSKNPAIMHCAWLSPVHNMMQRQRNTKGCIIEAQR